MDNKDKAEKINRDQILEDINDNLETLTREQLTEYMIKLSLWLSYMSETLAKKEKGYNAAWVVCINMGCSVAEAKVRSRAGQAYKELYQLEKEFDATIEIINSLKKRLGITEGDRENTPKENYRGRGRS